jgi:hypothetical protein
VSGRILVPDDSKGFEYGLDLILDGLATSTG